jgi:transcriptional regulator with XRE-family HTH domain
MPRSIPPPLSLALAVLRLARGWVQGELAKATGISGKMISRYETGRAPLTRELLETMAAALGYGPDAIDRTLLHLQEIGGGEPEPSGCPVAPTGEERRIIARAVAARALAEAEELARSLQTLKMQQARQQARQLWDYLRARPAHDRRVLVEGGREYQSWALCELLCSVSEKAAANDAGKAVELAALAVRIAELVPEEGIRQGLQGYAWAYLGNARRVQGNHPAADEAFARSDRFLSAGAPGISGLLETALLPDLKASLRRPQGRFEEALKLHDEALAKARPEDYVSVLLNKAGTLEEMERYDESIATLKQAEPLVDALRKPRDLFALRFILTLNLSRLGRDDEAENLLPEVKRLVGQIGTRLDELRLRWLEGKIVAGLGQKDKALAAFSQVRAAFIELGIAFDTALVTLELATIHLELGHTGEVRTLARQMVAVFESQGGNRESLAALRLYRDAAERETATVELTRRMVDYLHRARRNPGLEFQL